MRFQSRSRSGDEPEINLIPFIDVLLVVLIFLMLSTTYSRYSELQINLPTAGVDRLVERPGEILVSVSAEGRYAINRQPLDGRSLELLTAALGRAAEHAGKTPVVIVSADALAAHHSVVNVLDAARRADQPRLTFATQLSAPGTAR